VGRGIRTQIMLLATGLTLGTCLLICVGLYAGLRYFLHQEVDGFLDGEVHEFRAILENDKTGDLKDIEREIRSEIGSRRNADLVFRLLDNGGNLLITSDAEDRLPNPWSRVHHPDGGLPRVEYTTIGPDSMTGLLRVCTLTDQVGGLGVVAIQAVYRMYGVERSLAWCRHLCLAATVFALAISIIGGRLVARRSIQPVIRITNAARLIEARRLSSRVPLTGTMDELDTLAETLNDMLDRMERAFRQIQQFTADAAHELRTPLTALRGSAEFALSQPRNERELREVIEKSLEYYRLLSHVTNDLLLLARLDAGQEPLQVERFDLARAVDDVVDFYRPLAAEHQIEILLRGDEALWIQADSGKIRRVFNNLIDNSIKYMGGKGTIMISLSRSTRDAIMTVRDTGPGIAAADLPHVFDRFYRADRARKEDDNAKSRSAGLGLAICKSLVNAHRGEIDITSNPGSGTDVLIRIPLGLSPGDLALSVSDDSMSRNKK